LSFSQNDSFMRFVKYVCFEYNRIICVLDNCMFLMIEIAVVDHEDEKIVPPKNLDKNIHPDKKDINKIIQDFWEEYNKKIKKLEIIFWKLDKKLEKRLSDDESFSYDVEKRWIMWAMQKDFEKIQSFIYPEVIDKIKDLSKYVDVADMLIVDILNDKKSYSWGVFDETRNYIDNIFNYNDYDYVDLDKDTPKDTEMFDYIENKTNDRSRIFISKLENIKYEKYIDLEASVLMFAHTFDDDQRYDYILEKILQNNCSLIETGGNLFRLGWFLKNKANLAKSYKDIIDNNQNLSLLLIENLVSNWRYSGVMIKTAWNEGAKKAAQEMSNEQYRNIVDTIGKYLLLNDLTKENADKIYTIIEKSIKDEDKTKLLTFKNL